MTGNTGARIVLAAVQARSEPGKVAANLEHAEPLVEQAAVQRARLVVLPELFSYGYVPMHQRQACQAATIEQALPHCAAAPRDRPPGY